MKRNLCTGKAILIFSAILLITVCLGACRQSTAHEEKPSEKTKVIVKAVTCISENAVISVSGFLEADKTVPLSFLVPGKVNRVYFDEGDHVKKGQLLAKIEIDDYQSNLEIAEARLLKAQDAHDRLKPLCKDGAIAEKDFVEIKAGLAMAKAARNIARKKFVDTKLYSPIPGIIGAKNVEPGQTISAGMPVFTIVKTDRIFAKVGIPQSEIGKIVLGQKAMVTVQALEDTSLEGRVTLIGAMAEPRTRTYTVKIELANADYALRTGMIAKAQIVTGRKIEMITVPGKAVVRDAANMTYVFLVGNGLARAFKRRVFPGSVYQNEIEIKKGLKPDDLVIIGGQHKLSDGAPILVVEI